MPTELTGLTASMHVVLSAASFGQPEKGKHPNKMTFKGVLVRLDEPSNKPPGGADGHRIMLPSAVARKRLDTLIGMGLNYSPSLDAHAQRRKVGVIEDAGITGKDLWVKGYVWKHDFPEAEDDLKQHGLGMSMELGDVKVVDPKADVWELDDCCFLGGTILWKDKAAYHNTRAIAAAKQGGGDMAKPVPAKKPVKKNASTTGTLDEAQIAKIAASAAASAVGTVLAGTLDRQTKLMESMQTQIAALAADEEETEDENATVNASEDENEIEAGDDTDADVDARESDDEDEEDDEGEEDDEDEVDATSAENKPGSENSDTANHGDDTDCDDNVGPTVKKPITGAAAKTIKTLRHKLQNRDQKISGLQAEVAKLTKSMAKMQKQVTAAAERTTRRSVSAESLGLLAKANINASSLVESGQKLSVGDVDAVLAAAESAIGVKFSTEQRITAKNRLFNEGLADEGRVVRNTQ